MSRPTSKELNYRDQKQTCKFCNNMDLIKNDEDEVQFICYLTKEPVEEFTICDSWTINKS